MKVASRESQEGQSTVGVISIDANIAQEFEARWIDSIIELVHLRRAMIGTKNLKKDIEDYRKEFNGAPVRIDFEYPFFVEKLTPVSKEKCLVKYSCRYSVKASSGGEPTTIFKVDVPVMTTFPQTSLILADRPFAQLSVVTIEIESSEEVYPEDLVELVDKHALAPLYSFLTPEDQDFIIRKVHKELKSSVVMVDEIKEELAHNSHIAWFSVRCANFGMLHSYSTFITSEKSSWAPFSSYAQELDKERGL